MSIYRYFWILSVLLMGSTINGAKVFNQYPLANDYFDIVYVITDQGQPPSSHQQTWYLRVFCKEHNTLSISFTETMEFEEAPRFPTYNPQSNPSVPKFQQEIYTFLSACSAQIKINPTQDSIVSIIRKESNESIFELKDVTLSPGHNKFTIIDRSVKWGLGERYQSRFRVTDGSWTIFNRDKPWEIDQGKHDRSSSTYGHQPVYLARETTSGYTHMVYFKNTFGMVVESSQESEELTYNSVGGNVHFILIVGDRDPEATVSQYHNFIGGVHIPPFWALGFHQCRWGYKDINVYEKVIEGYDNHEIPLDTMWNDLDYMEHKAIFTIDSKTYPPGKLNSLLQEKQLHWIPLIDVGVSLKDDESISLGEQEDVFLRDINNPSKYYVGEVWPGKVHFVDYLHPNASFFWRHQLKRLYDQVPFSGVWLDMNEPSNFKGNEPIQEQYRIQHSQTSNMMTINMNLQHYSWFNKSETLSHYEVHSYYGHMSVVPTYDFLQQQGKRPFIISRSNAVGTGTYAGHWTGDNSATWQFLRLSISGNFLFQIFGMQMVGADICGFHEDTTPELCARWIQLGSLYPFSRNHNQDIAKSQQLYVLGAEVAETSKISLRQRYSLLKQLYSILIKLQGKGTFFRPLYFEFYEDSQSLNQQIIETQFLLGRYLLSAPVVERKQESRNVYFPGNDSVQWYPLEYSLKRAGEYSQSNVRESINGNKELFYSGGKNSKLNNKQKTAPLLFLRSGYIIFTNQPQQRSRRLDNVFYLTAALDSQNKSAENQFLTIDDYENEEVLGKCIENEQCLTKFTLSKTSKESDEEFKLSWKFDGPEKDFGMIRFKKITVWSEDKEWVSADEEVKIETIKGETILKLKLSN